MLKSILPIIKNHIFGSNIMMLGNKFTNFTKFLNLLLEQKCQTPRLDKKLRNP